MSNDVVCVLEGFSDPIDTTDMMIGKDDVTFINQDDDELKMDQVSMEDAVGNARKVKRIILAESNEASLFTVSCEAIAAMVNGTAEDLIIVNDTRKGFNYEELPVGKTLFREMRKYVTIVDNIHEAKSFL